MDTGLRTLEEPRDERAVRRARNYRRVGLGLVLLAVLAGLTGLLGIRSSTASARGGGSLLEVEHAQVTRAGIAVPSTSGWCTPGASPDRCGSRSAPT